MAFLFVYMDDLRVAHAVPVLGAVSAAQPPAPAADIPLALICT